MTVYGAMNAAVAGMKAQSRSMGHISENIANSSTVGFKRVDTGFAELVTVSNRATHAPGGVIATPRFRHNIQGDLTQTQVATNMAVSGSGFFVVSAANSVTPQGVTFDSNDLFTRRGDFELDKFGYLRNGGGYYLNGRQVIDQTTLNTSDLLTPIRIQTDVMQARATTTINYAANLPAQASPLVNRDVTVTPSNNNTTNATLTISQIGNMRGGDAVEFKINNRTYREVVNDADSNGSISSAEVQTALSAIRTRLQSAGYTVSAPTGGTSDASMSISSTASVQITEQRALGGILTANYFAQSDASAFYADAGSFSGGAVTVFNQTGTPIDLQFRWMRLAGNENSDATWALAIQNPNGSPQWSIVDADANTTTGVNLSSNATGISPFSFASDGSLQNSGTSIDLTIQGVGPVSLSFLGVEGQTQLTQYYQDDIAIYRLDQDGYQAGILSDVAINDYGYVVANYDNGRSRVLYQVPLATFASPNEMDRMNGGAFARTPESGDPLIAEMGTGGAGAIVASATENSNVDIADEFTKMIVTQRAYSANSRTVTTADRMLEEVINMKR